MKPDKFIERKIIIGAIVSTEYLSQVHPIWESRYVKSATARKMIGWCMDFFIDFKKAPVKEIESIYIHKLKQGLPEEEALEIEEDILPGLSEEYENDKFNLDYLLAQTRQYFTERKLELHSEEVKAAIISGDHIEAEKLISEYSPFAVAGEDMLNLGNENVLQEIDRAFLTTSQSVLTYPRQLGDFWNEQLTRGSFVAFLAPEKRGKSYWLLDMAVRAAGQKAKVAFFQAGDMTQAQQLRRLCIHLTRKSDKDKYIGKMYEPVRDCVLNQLDKCQKSERECDFGVFDNMTEKQVRKEVTLEALREAFKDNPTYKPCFNCKEYWTKYIGAVWLREVEVKSTLTSEQAKRAVNKFFVDNKRQFILSTHANDTLTVRQIKGLLSIWERQYNFVPDIILIDYADLLVSESKSAEYRHQQNNIWKALRGLSQEKHCLVVTATQADAESYTKNLLSMKNYSEDKRKFAHVTAMYGLNQDPAGREKEIGIMRINEIVVREGEFNSGREVYVLQNLKRGQPVLASYF